MYINPRIITIINMQSNFTVISAKLELRIVKSQFQYSLL